VARHWTSRGWKAPRMISTPGKVRSALIMLTKNGPVLTSVNFSLKCDGGHPKGLPPFFLYLTPSLRPALLHGRSVATWVWRGKVDGAPCAVGLPGPRAQGLAACRTAGSEREPKVGQPGVKTPFGSADSQP
jgi:hypothetical protein